MRRMSHMRRASPRLRRPATTDQDAVLDGTAVDANEEAPETGPMRRCVVTRERLPKEQMFRFVISPDRALTPDLAGKLPGRGIWLSASRDVIEGPHGTNASGTNPCGPNPSGTNPGGTPSNGAGPSLTRQGAKGRELVRAVARAAHGPVRVPPDLPVVLEAALIRRIGDLLGLARRAGQAIAGFEKARDWMRSHPVGLVLQAADGSEAERARFRSAVPDAVTVLDPLTGAELGRVFGHDAVVHVALAPGRLAGSIAMEVGRLTGLRTTTRQRTDAGTPQGTPQGMGREASRGKTRREDDPAAKAGGTSRAMGQKIAETNDATDTNG
jgi:uncharacterized protein